MRLAVAGGHAIDREVGRRAAVGVAAAVALEVVSYAVIEVSDDAAEVVGGFDRARRRSCRPAGCSSASSKATLSRGASTVLAPLVSALRGGTGSRCRRSRGHAPRPLQREVVARRAAAAGNAHVAVVEAAHRVLLRGDGAVGARCRCRCCRRSRRGAGTAPTRGTRARSLTIGPPKPPSTAIAAVGAVAGTGTRPLVVLARLDAVELDDAGGGVAAEQRALRAAQHFNLLHVEDRVGLQHDVFQHHIVLDDRHRLRGGQVEVDVAEAADVEAREDAAGGGFGVEAGHAADSGPARCHRRRRCSRGCARPAPPRPRPGPPAGCVRGGRR
jgi:hypothetical protein